jgi:hypothetical protein
VRGRGEREGAEKTITNQDNCKVSFFDATAVKHVSSSSAAAAVVVAIVIVVVAAAAAPAAIAEWEEENLCNTTTLSFQHFSGTRVQQKSNLIIHTTAIITKNLLVLLLHKI